MPPAVTADSRRVAQNRRSPALAQIPKPVAERDNDQKSTQISATMTIMGALIAAPR